jgi:HK97 family phage major capsid protein
MTMTYKELKAKMVQNADAQNAITTVAESAKRDLTADENTKLVALQAEFEAQSGQLAILEKAEKAQAFANSSAGRKTKPDDVTAIHDKILDDPKRGYQHLRSFVGDVIAANTRGVEADNLKYLRDPESTVGSDEGAGTAGGRGAYLIPEGFNPTFLKVSPEADPMAGRVQTIPMDKPVVNIPARTDKDHTTSVSGGLTVTRRPETVSATDSKMVVERVRLEATTLTALTYVTEELLADTPLAFAAIVGQGFQDEFTSHLVDERLNGTGAGEFLGVMNSPCLVIVAKEAGQAAGTITYPNVLNMRSRCWHYSDAIWIANHDTLPQLAAMSLPVGVGGTAVWMPSCQPDVPDMLLGRPLIFSEYAKTKGAKGDIVLGNWSQYLEGTYQPMASAESIHVRFVNHERTLKFWLRNAGQPWWKSPLTPRNSTATLSPFVTLAVRA